MLTPHEIDLPTDEQVARMVRATANTPLGIAIMLSAQLGLRRAEICALTWSDLRDGVLYITKAMVMSEEGWIIKSPKTTSSIRSLPVPAGLQAALDALEHTGDRIMDCNPDALYNRFRRLCKAHGLNLRLHSLRHYNASVMLALGVPDKYAMARMGHSTPNMLRRVYQHLQDTKSMQIADYLDQYFSQCNTKCNTEPEKDENNA